MIKQYYYIDGQGKRCGPLDFCDLNRNVVGRETYVWCTGLENWVKAKDIPELQSLFNANDTNDNGFQRRQAHQTQRLAHVHEADVITHEVECVQENAQRRPKVNAPEKPQNFLVWTILSTICCCVPIGCYAIYCSVQVDSSYKAGNYSDASSWSVKAKKWAIIAAVLGAVSGVLYGILNYLAYEM